MTTSDDDRLDDELTGGDEDTAEAENEFSDGDEALPESDLDEFESDAEDGVDDEIDTVVEISSKEQNARSLEIRRAIEERMEKRQMEEDLDYLDYDLDD